MNNIKFMFNNKCDPAGSPVLSVSTESVNFPKENVQTRWKSRGWRSQYGPGVGGGRFEITALNNKFYFYENTVITTLTATLTVGTYNAVSLCTELKTQMEAVGANTYTVSYDSTSLKFSIDILTGTNFGLEYGANGINSAIGFQTSGWLGWLTTYTAPSVRIHTSESITFTYPVQIAWDFLAVFGHNVQTTGSIKFQFSNDNFVTIPIDITPVRGSNLLCYFPASTINYQYVRILISDPDNPDGYSTVCRTWGGLFDLAPSHGISPKHDETVKDLSVVRLSEGGQASSIQRPHYYEWTVEFQHIQMMEEFRAMLASRGFSKELVVLRKKTSSTTPDFMDKEDHLHYCRIKSFPPKHRAGQSWNGSMKLVEEL